jgi:radical SAM superfamily enzyme YgiQ (UPF0313 family)
MGSKMRIGFILASNEIDVHWYRPLSYGYLKAYLDKYLDSAAEISFLDNVEEFEKCEIIAISSTSQDFARARELARHIKDKNKEIITIIGGHHITYLPETLSDEFDIGVIGEGEETFLDLIQCIMKIGIHPKFDDLKKIQGIVFREDGEMIRTPKRELIDPLDKIPFPHRSKGSDLYLLSSRGCPYKCAFCSSAAFWEKTRFFSPEYVVREIEFLLEQFPKTRNIFVWDDLFISKIVRFKKIVELLRNKGINKKVTFTLPVRANLVNEELCKDLKEMNVVGVSFGAESGSNRILEILGKRMTVEMNQMAIDTLYEYGILVGCSFIVGTPTETEGDVRDTYEFILKNIAERKLSPRCSVNILMPMPGTEMWRYAVRAGLIDMKDMDWKRLSIFASYRDSNIGNFREWTECRRKNRSIYLAGETLPEERLYELMYIYENAIQSFERTQVLAERERAILESPTWRLSAPLRKIMDCLRGKNCV